jgi:hypothetical protein
MIWLTWRQHRAQMLFAAGALAAIAVFLLPTGLGMLHTFRNTGLAACLAVSARNCGDLADQFSQRYNNLQFTIPLFMVLPALAGLFWGAPLVARDVEQGTHRLAWTQSVTRTRWFTSRAAAMIGLTACSAALVSWGLSWWSRPLVTASDARFNYGVFDLRGVVPIAYAVFALAVGVAVGVLIRRTLPAMAATLGGYALVRIAVEVWARPHYLPLQVRNFAFVKGAPIGKGDWVVSQVTVDRAGHLFGDGRGIDLNKLASRCPGFNPSPFQPPDRGKLTECIQQLGLHLRVTYQPGSRYWLFQGIESAIFVALAAGLLVLSAWWIRRRLA